jgi:hypothetical protein
MEATRDHIKAAQNHTKGEPVLCCGKKSLAFRISGPDKYRQVLLGFQMGVYRPMLKK